jgi:hypothetical protein
MDIKTSIGWFSSEDFVKKCNEQSFPEGLEVHGSIDLRYSSKDLTQGLKVGGNLSISLKSLPEGLKVGGALNLFGCSSFTSLPTGLQVGAWLNLRECSSLRSLPDGLKVGAWLDLHRCSSLTALPDGLQVGDTVYVDTRFIKQYPFRDLPKILHLPFQEDKKQVLLERLQSGY